MSFIYVHTNNIDSIKERGLTITRAVMESLIQRLSSRRWPITMHPQRRATNRVMESTETWSPSDNILTPNLATASNPMIATSHNWSRNTSVSRFTKCLGRALADTPPTISFNYNCSSKWTKHSIDTNKYTFLTLSQLCINVPVTNTSYEFGSKFKTHTLQITTSKSISFKSWLGL